MLGRRGRLTPSLRRAFIILPFWIAATLWMWGWWLFFIDDRFLPLYIPLTLALMYEFVLLPSIFLYFVIKAKKPARRVAPKDKKVAVISLCVPSSESIDIVERQLKAMSEITYPHDSWILDEGNSKEIKALAKEYGVKHFSRKGVRKYNQPGPPFQKKTKAGNVNAWLEHVKWRRYEYFVQLDIDHLPKPNYLNKTLGYFKDPIIGWVQAPSVYGNLKNWIARGAAEQELVLQGPLQMGFYGHSDTPFIIGSHCTYRMSAIRKIGGFQPTRAEDHLDTVYLAHHGYRGVFLPEIIAEGDGPETLNTYLAQQFAWAYSMFQVLIGHTPKLIKAMPWRRRWQFIFAQTWYPLWALSYFVMFMSPVVALWLRQEIVSVDPLLMLTHFAPVFIGGFVIWWTARPLMQPKNVRLSWRGMILHAVRWPVIFRAIVEATFKIKKPYMITPKGKFAHLAPSLKTYKPFLFLGLLSSMTAVVIGVGYGIEAPQAQILFAITNAVFMLTICTVDISLRIRQSKPSLNEIRNFWLKPISATSSLAIAVLVALSLPISAVSNQLAVAQKRSDQGDISVELSQPIVVPVHYEMTKDELLTQISLVDYDESRNVPQLGLYHDSFELPRLKENYIQHTFVDWRDDHYLAYALAKILQAGNIPLITIEPHGETDGQILLQQIIDGLHDDTLNGINEVISLIEGPLYLRFAHEMELTDLYPWGDQNPALFISAYQYVVETFRDSNNEIDFVWSPAGNVGAEAYYPGDEYVDIIGTTILYDEYWYGQDWWPSFAVLAQSRQWLNGFDQPVWIVEFGVGKANRVHQEDLIQQAKLSFTEYGYEALIYIDLIDANIVGPDYRLASVHDFGNFFYEESPPEATSPEERPVMELTEILCYRDSASLNSLNYIQPNLQSSAEPLQLRHCQ